MMIEAALVILECEVPNLREGVHTGGHVANLNRRTARFHITEENSLFAS